MRPARLRHAPLYNPSSLPRTIKVILTSYTAALWRLSWTKWAGRTVMIADHMRFFMTAKMEIKYRQPVPTGLRLRAVGKLLKLKERRARGRQRRGVQGARRTGRVVGRDRRVLARGHQPRVAAARGAGRADRDPDRARDLHRLRGERSHPAHGRLQGGEAHPSRQHRS